MERESVLTLFRVCTVRDKNNGYILDSTCKEKLNNERLLQEMVSHELNARTGRGVFYSFTFDYELAKAYKVRNPGNTEICSVEVDLSELQSGIKGIFPIYLRDYWMNLIYSTIIVRLKKEQKGLSDALAFLKDGKAGLRGSGSRTGKTSIEIRM